MEVRGWEVGRKVVGRGFRGGGGDKSLTFNDVSVFEGDRVKKIFR